MAAKTIMVQGTASGVGKSLLVTGLCRIFSNRGYKVAPYKSQNMALNSFVTKDGGEIGRAQAVQAQAACVEPTVDMNPILLKPKKDYKTQVIVHGKPVGDMTAQEYHKKFRDEAWGAMMTSLKRVMSEYDVIVIEGAGSPAEVNLRDFDIVNMAIAKAAEAPVLLVADIDKGGALASIVGTLNLIESEERELIMGLVINKFRGDRELLEPALDFLETDTGKPVLGVIPYVRDLGIQEEDSIPVLEMGDKTAEIDIAVIRLPHISNFTDFDYLTRENGVKIRYVSLESELKNADAVIIPGSKSTVEDLMWLRANGFIEKIKELNNSGVPVIGICGGYQMLGEKLYDSEGLESKNKEIEGLGLLPTVTYFSKEKITKQVEAHFMRPLKLFPGTEGHKFDGYEIHSGRTKLLKGTPVLSLCSRAQKEDIGDGAVSSSELAFGTYIHDLFINKDIRRAFINNLRVRKKLPPLKSKAIDSVDFREKSFERWAQILSESLEIKKIFELAGI
ncbi:cobyric acid synthase [Candidatus Oleimmundimicrobium sp.]|uniref:cobyric acid synthase n=1 Tax=Candidatus Oleimmundimicrobium sp. TaxID=3060597 RepID=UPI002719DA05|nr:cobyric acid synthase [Candidatus Oleimmundimicrobium sp.]MDO8885281.1 cobyric acid synthase [Candidatus Oleimmundimicrobium sp.]